jgi:hypothetical protein
MPHMAKGMCNRCYQREWSRLKSGSQPKVVKTPLITETELRHLYLEKQLSTPKIARMKSCASVTIRNYLKKYGIPARGPVLSQEVFISRCQKVWGEKYDLSKSIYRGAKEPLYVECKVEGHGGFWVSNADTFARKLAECPKCQRHRKLTVEHFLELAAETHGDQYGYDRVSDPAYHKKVEIHCREHGYYSQTCGSHLSGNGCPKCANQARADFRRRSADEVIKEFRSVHGERYDYSRMQYIDNQTPVEIVCSQHGVFLQTPGNHQSGKGCYPCGRLLTSDKHRKDTDWFVEQATQIYGDLYDYSEANYTAKKAAVTIICPEHGPFTKTPDHHLRGQGCPGCADYGFDQTKPAIVYYLRIDRFNQSPLYKIGITNRTVDERWTNDEDRSRITTIKLWQFDSGRDAQEFEQKVLKRHSDEKYDGPPVLQTGNTELFSCDVLQADDLTVAK